MLQTEFEFTLPRGFVDGDGNLHRQGTMRLANAKDEILPLQDPRVRKNEAYLTIIVLSRVVTKLGDLEDVNPGVIENLFSADLAYLQDFYNKINEGGDVEYRTHCPHCDRDVRVSASDLVEEPAFFSLKGYPSDALHEEIAYIAYHFHWDYESLLDMHHRERLGWVREIADINKRRNDDAKKAAR